ALRLRRRAALQLLWQLTGDVRLIYRGSFAAETLPVVGCRANGRGRRAPSYGEGAKPPALRWSGDPGVAVRASAVPHPPRRGRRDSAWLPAPRYLARTSGARPRKEHHGQGSSRPPDPRHNGFAEPQAGHVTSKARAARSDAQPQPAARRRQQLCRQRPRPRWKGVPRALSADPGRPARGTRIATTRSSRPGAPERNPQDALPACDLSRVSERATGRFSVSRSGPCGEPDRITVGQ